MSPRHEHACTIIDVFGEPKDVSYEVVTFEFHLLTKSGGKVRK